jgi:hypothetical protein
MDEGKPEEGTLQAVARERDRIIVRLWGMKDVSATKISYRRVLLANRTRLAFYKANSRESSL